MKSSKFLRSLRRIYSRNRHLLHKFMKYLFGGGVGFIIIFLSTYLLTDIVGVNYLYSYAVALVLGALWNFIFACKVIFVVNDKKHIRLLKYALVVIVFYFINLFSVKLFVDIFRIYYLISITVITILLNIAKFVTYDKLVFNKYKV